MRLKNYIDEAKLKYLSPEWMKAVDELKAIGGAKIIIDKNNWDWYVTEQKRLSLWITRDSWPGA
jgi:hypothetical protein